MASELGGGGARVSTMGWLRAEGEMARKQVNR
jgi:hypothetical protein